MSRLTRFVALVAALGLAALVGLDIGLEIGTRNGVRMAQRPILVHCAESTERVGDTYPCPPEPGIETIATWGALTTRAVWTGARWEFPRHVLGQDSTNLPADAWHALPEATR